MAPSESGVWPNPSTSRQWTDGSGRVWHRRGDRGECLEPKRVRTLLRRDGLLLAIWSAGEVTWFERRDQKQAAADELQAQLDPHGDIREVEWKSDNGDHMLMLEHSCEATRS